MSPEEKAEATGRYFLPRNVEEAERMQNQHEWLKGGADGLVLAPIDLQRRGMRVLDSATADGYWMKDVKANFPDDTEFLRFDNAPEGYPPLSTNPPLKIVQQSLVGSYATTLPLGQKGAHLLSKDSWCISRAHMKRFI
ncbi:hypothetical protein N7536_004293 [Penicillium majusculum]|uniref:Uncharacterized protein n=1 Tax=Penicillium solitum TaxID=60172 RepID=A0A1V6QMC7_9EURO|nr:uncharacterized protein PENSOL_c058G07791 [Penicillium solitum]KAJ5693881.1 hypothetical protein N7536_004293 [Penicillium majusculum]OQD90331.1 hypothetical protein PENSOL_c058G07791 [Penicillium solitum]